MLNAAIAFRETYFAASDSKLMQAFL